MRKIDPQRLKDLLDELVTDPAYAAEQLPDGSWKTKCNLALCAVAEEFGVTVLRGLVADEVVSLARSSELFRELDGESASQWAATGGFAFGGRTSSELDEAHGHVATVAPMPPAESGSLQKLVPYLCNVGLPPNAIKLSSACFPVKLGECQYFAYVGG